MNCLDDEALVMAVSVEILDRNRTNFRPVPAESCDLLIVCSGVAFRSHFRSSVN